MLVKGYAKEIEGYLGVYCECGNACYIKNQPNKRGERVIINCPCCGNKIETVYRRER